MRSAFFTAIRALLSILALAGCSECTGDEERGASAPALAREEVGPDAPIGWYRAILRSPGGELPFALHVDGQSATVRNGEEAVPFSATFDGETLTLTHDVYPARIEATVSETGELRGRWVRQNREGTSTLSLLATPSTDSNPTRFLPLAEEAVPDAPALLAGIYRARIEDADGGFDGRLELTQDGRRVAATILTATGDYRYLVGAYEGGRLRLSTFDGSNAYLFSADMRPDGSLAGDFWSRDTYHAAFVLSPHDPSVDGEILPDALSEVRVTSADQRLRFSFRDQNGDAVALPSEALSGRVVVVNVFGTWCPNCNDEAPILGRLFEQHQQRGLSIVGLAFEHDQDPGRAAARIAAFAERHGARYPIALAGPSDKAATHAALPDLSEIRSYPTTIYIDRAGRVRRIHSGFSGPATGEHHIALVAEMESFIEDLLSERVDEIAIP